MTPRGIRLIRGLLMATAAMAVVVLSVALLTRAWGAYRLSTAKAKWAEGPGPLDLRGFVNPRPEPEKNAATWIRPGVEAVLLFGPDRERVARLAYSPADSWTAEDRQALDVILTRNTPALELLQRARGMQLSSWSIPYDQGFSATIPNLMGAMHAAKLLAARARLAAYRGDPETALASLEVLGAMARSYEKESMSLLLLVASSIERCQIAVLHDLMIRPELGQQGLARLEAGLSDEALGQAFKRSLRYEAAMLAKNAAEGDIACHAPCLLPRPLLRGLAEGVAASNLEEFLAMAREDPSPVLVPVVQRNPTASSWWGELSAAYSPDLSGVGPRVVAAASARDLARLALALRRAAFANGEYPDALPEIAGLPSMDPLTGTARVYERHPDGSAEVRAATNEAILRSIVPVGFMSQEALYRWTLPAPR